MPEDMLNDSTTEYGVVRVAYKQPDSEAIDVKYFHEVPEEPNKYFEDAVLRLVPGATIHATRRRLNFLDQTIDEIPR